MKVLNREGIIRMGGRSQGGGGVSIGGGSGSVAGLASEAWVEENYISKAFFNRLFTIHSASSVIDPNDPDEEQTIDSIEALVGLWTEQYLSALGQGSGGGGGGGITLNDPLDAINSAGLSDPVTAGSALVWYGGAWTYSPSARLQVAGLNSSAAVSVTGSVTATSFVRQGGTSAMFLKADGSVDTTVYAAQDWVNQNFITIAFFETLFNAVDANGNKVNANTTTGIDSIKAMFGFWTNQYLSALGQGSGGGGGGVTLNQPLSSINSAGLGAPSVSGSTLVWNGTTWTYSSSIGDTKNTAGSSAQPSGVQLYLIGASAQATWGVTYSNIGCYIGTDGYLYSGGSKVLTSANIPLASTGTIGGILVKAATAATPTLAAGSTADRYYGLQIDGNGVAFVNVPWTDTTYSQATADNLGLMKVQKVLTSAVNLETATTQQGKNYGIQIDSQGRFFVCVPWSDTNTTYSAATTSALGLIKVHSSVGSAVTLETAGTTDNRNYGVQLDSNSKAFVCVPWTDTNTTYSSATTSALGLLKVSNKLSTSQNLTETAGTTANRFYGVQMDSNGVAFVNVPWSNTTYSVFGGATANANGTSGLVPAPEVANRGQYLRGDGQWGTPTNTTYSSATTSALGLLKVSNKLSTSQNLTETAGTTANRFYGVQMDSNGVAFVNVPWSDTNTTYTFTDNNPTLAWSTKSKVATVGGVAINVTMPANPASNRLPLSGGTLTGALGSNSNYLIKPVADFRNTTSAYTGCIAITLPASIGDGMLAMWIDVYNNSSNSSFSIYCCGYTYQDNKWYNCAAFSLNVRKRVRFGYTGTNFIIYIGETNTVWSYPQVTVRNVLMGHNAAYDKLYNNWTISFATSVRNVTADITRGAIASGETFGGASTDAAGSSGLVPAPAQGSQGLFLRGDGNWATPTNTTYSSATTSALGLLKVSNKLSTSQNLTETAGTTANRFYGVQMDSNGVAFVNVPWSDTNTTYTFTDNNPTLAWSTKSKVATVGGVAINVTMPANPNTDSKTSSSASNSSFLYLVGALTQSTSGVTTYTNSSCYIGTDGLLYSGNNKVLYNSTDFCVKDGQVGIGTNSPAYKLDVVGNAQFGGNSVTKTRIGSANISMVANNGTSYNIMAVSQDSNNHQNCSFGYGLRTLSGSSTYVHGNTVRISTNGTERMNINTNGNVGIGVDNSGSGYKLQINGACAGTSWTNLSDMRQKNYVEDENIELWQVANAPLFKFTWKNPQFGADLHIGSSAQYWQTIVPEAVTTDGIGNLGLQYDVVALLAAITTAKKVQEHERRIEELERENKVLWNMIASLKAA